MFQFQGMQQMEGKATSKWTPIYINNPTSEQMHQDSIEVHRDAQKKQAYYRVHCSSIE